MSSLSGYLQPTLTSTIDNIQQTSGNSLANNLSAATPPDSAQISPVAQLLSTLQQVQQTDPGKYSQATQAIAGNLEGAALEALHKGDIGGANRLKALAADFANASKNAQSPDLQQLLKSLNGDNQTASSSDASQNSALASSGVTAAGAGA